MGGRLGVCLDKPVTDKANERGAANGLRYGVSAMQGYRVHMEDAHVSMASLADVDPSLADWSFFAVFDGHGGAGAAHHCRAHLLRAILDSGAWQEGRWADALVDGFVALDASMRLRDDAYALGGTTAVCALVSPTDVYIANCGDSRAIVCRDGRLHIATDDHKPERPDEEKRIRRAGGFITMSRLNGTLAVSRALGDYTYKRYARPPPCDHLVSPEPEITHVRRDLEHDHFLMLACDGVWDVMRNDDACAYVTRLLRIADDMTATTDRLLDACLSKGSDDNMSVVLVAFPAAPVATPEARRADESLDETIRRRIAELIGEQNTRTLIFPELSKIPELLPWGSVHDKMNMIESTLDEYKLNDDKPMFDDD